MAKAFRAQIKGIKNLEETTKKIVRAGIEDKETMQQAGQIIQRSIVGSARTGKNPDGESFKPLSKAWIKRKARLSEVNTTSEFYKKSRSNLSFTGQLLDSFSFSINKNILSFFFKGNRKPYKGIFKAQLEGPATNAELAESIEKERPFVFLGDKPGKQVTIMIIRQIKRKLRDFKRVSKLLSR